MNKKDNMILNLFVLLLFLVAFAVGGGLQQIFNW